MTDSPIDPDASIDADPPIDDFARHEALDRTSLILELFERSVLEHHVLEAYPHLKEKAEAVSAGLADLYSSMGAEFMGD